MARSLGLIAVACLLVVTACQRHGFDWDQPENMELTETSRELDDGSVEMRFTSLVSAPAPDLFHALAEVDHHAEFIEGVMESKLVSSQGNTKVVDIRNRVLGRPNQARIEWTLDEPNLTASFKTIEAQFTDNSAEYKLTASPDGQRTLITTIYHLRDKGGHPFPLHSLKTAIEDGYVAALRGVKRRALGPSKVVAH
jgi:hypothetical protein